jgi:hypothetical protein
MRTVEIRWVSDGGGYWSRECSTNRSMKSDIYQLRRHLHHGNDKDRLA